MMITQPGQSAPSWSRPGLWSLWDIMDNFPLHRVILILEILDIYVDTAKDSGVPTVSDFLPGRPPRVPRSLLPLDDFSRGHVKNYVEEAAKIFAHFDAHLLTKKMSRFGMRSTLFRTNGDLAAEIGPLSEMIKDELRNHFFLHCVPAAAGRLRSFQDDWANVLAAFPDAAKEAKLALECIAVGHDTASVFHSMRVAEHGLRALAKERRAKIKRWGKEIPIDWANWGEILNALATERDSIAKKAPSDAKEDALAFYGGAIADLNSFKDEYRNAVMHTRTVSYDEHDAAQAFGRVHAFMNRVSAKIDHRGQRIRWRF
jgi:hypothetical protein